MSWFRRRHKPRPQVDAAREARERAERELARVRAETPTYEALGDSMRQLREHNHFAQAIRATFQGGRP